jgi:uncharacterized protein (DUF2164 family)
MAITLPAETTTRLKQSIKRYFAEHLDDPDAGDLKSLMLLDFCLKEIAPTIYNQAIAEAQTYLQERVNDLEGVCYQAEFGYWPRTPVRKRPDRS